MAGLVCYYNGAKFHYLHISRDESFGKYLRVMSCLPDSPQTDAFTPLIPIAAEKPVHLRVEIDYERLQFAYRVDGVDKEWRWLPQQLDASILSDEATAPGFPNFTGAFVGMACQDLAGILFFVGVWAVPHFAFAADLQKSDGVLTSANQAQPADEWPQFRGPTGDGISLAANVPVTWSTNQNLKWKAPVAGRGRSSPVLLGDRIWLTTAFETNVRTFSAGPDRMQQAERVVIGVVCLDRATGKQLYYKELFPVDNPPAVNFFNSYATPTSVVEAGRLYCDFGTFGTACLDANSGEVLWKRQLPLEHFQGPGSSPALHKNLLILVRDGGDQQYITALDTGTGRTVWKSDRPTLSTPVRMFRKSFSTPLVFEAAGKVQMVVPGAQWFVSYDPETGQEIWRVDNGKGETVAPRPVYGNGLVYLSTGVYRPKPQLWAVRVHGQGDVTATHVAWKLPSSIGFMASPLLLGRELYLLSDDGFVTCADAASGEVLNKVRAGGNYAASPTYAEGRIYCFSREGKTLVFKANKELTVLAENQLDGPVFASPAVVNSAIYVRTETDLYCLSSAAPHTAD
jgi:outer membrane protein assembly factor BamB